MTVQTGTEDAVVVRAGLDACTAQLVGFKVSHSVAVIDELSEALDGKLSKAALRDEAPNRMGDG